MLLPHPPYERFTKIFSADRERLRGGGGVQWVRSSPIDPATGKDIRPHLVSVRVH